MPQTSGSNQTDTNVDRNAREYIHVHIIIIREGLESNQTDLHQRISRPIGAIVASLEWKCEKAQVVEILVVAAEDPQRGELLGAFIVAGVVVDVESLQSTSGRAEVDLEIVRCDERNRAPLFATTLCTTAQTLRRIHLNLQFGTAIWSSGSITHTRAGSHAAKGVESDVVLDGREVVSS